MPAGKEAGLYSGTASVPAGKEAGVYSAFPHRHQPIPVHPEPVTAYQNAGTEAGATHGLFFSYKGSSFIPVHPEPVEG